MVEIRGVKEKRDRVMQEAKEVEMMEAKTKNVPRRSSLISSHYNFSFLFLVLPSNNRSKPCTAREKDIQKGNSIVYINLTTREITIKNVI